MIFLMLQDYEDITFVCVNKGFHPLVHFYPRAFYTKIPNFSLDIFLTF